MAHWARLDETNVVVEVIVTDDNDENYEQILAEQRGGVWKKTSYNTDRGVHKTGGVPFRKNYASIGGIYDPIRDAFIPPKPIVVLQSSGRVIESVFNEETCNWDLMLD